MSGGIQSYSLTHSLSRRTSKPLFWWQVTGGWK